MYSNNIISHPIVLNLPIGNSCIHFLEKFDFKFKKTNSLIVVDSNTNNLIDVSMDNCVVIPAGDQSKNLDWVKTIIQKATIKHLDRNAIFYAVGGGVVCDITAFSASIYKRGVRCHLIPTSLLAMVDASVGGKTGVNLDNVKNVVGSFYPAENIYICSDFLKTLPKRELDSGLAEIFKMGIIDVNGIFEIMSKQRHDCICYDKSVLDTLIKLSVKAKAKFVIKDFFEKNIRKFLNFGHTFGHALESLTGFNVFSHGEAVAWGITQAIELGLKLNLTDVDYAQSVLELINFYNWETNFIPEKVIAMHTYDFNKNHFCQKIIEYMLNDKKNSYGKVNIVLQKKMGENCVYEITEDELNYFFKEQLKNENK